VSLANFFSILRIILSPLLIVLALYGNIEWYMVLICGLLISDYLDGWFARRYQQVTELGAKLDSLGDLVSICCILLSVWLLWPMRIEPVLNYIFVAIGCYISMFILHFIKFRTTPSFHSILAKVTTLLGLPVLAFLVFFGYIWLAKAYTILVILVSVEYIAITIVLQKYQTDVNSLFHILCSKIRKK